MIGSGAWERLGKLLVDADAAGRRCAADHDEQNFAAPVVAREVIDEIDEPLVLQRGLWQRSRASWKEQGDLAGVLLFRQMLEDPAAPAGRFGGFCLTRPATARSPSCCCCSSRPRVVRAARLAPRRATEHRSVGKRNGLRLLLIGLLYNQLLWRRLWFASAEHGRYDDATECQ